MGRRTKQAGARIAARMLAAWVYLQPPFPVTPSSLADSPAFLVARPSSTARFSQRAVSRVESFRAFSLRVSCYLVTRRLPPNRRVRDSVESLRNASTTVRGIACVVPPARAAAGPFPVRSHVYAVVAKCHGNPSRRPHPSNLLNIECAPLESSPGAGQVQCGS